MEKEYDKCLRCGKPLKSLQSRQLGYGKQCYLKTKTTTSIPTLIQNLKTRLNK